MMSRKGDDTRIRILNSAWQLLENPDGSAVRMSDIARTAGISRQALYLHFPNRADLLVATTRHIDTVKDIDARLAASRAATGGIERMEAYIAAWGDYIPQIHGVAMALMSLQDHDAEARIAWAGRETAMREGCAAAIIALQRDGRLTPAMSPEAATDLLWTLLSVRNWDRLVQECGWSQARYIQEMQRLARAALVAR
jgi:AcrR family transcriptional regulator